MLRNKLLLKFDLNYNYTPSVLIFKAVLTSAKSVALKVTVPSLFSGMFMEIRR